MVRGAFSSGVVTVARILRTPSRFSHSGDPAGGARGETPDPGPGRPVREPRPVAVKMQLRRTPIRTDGAQAGERRPPASSPGGGRHSGPEGRGGRDPNRSGMASFSPPAFGGLCRPEVGVPLPARRSAWWCGHARERETCANDVRLCQRGCRTAFAVKMQSHAGPPTVPMAPQARERRPLVGTRGSAKPALMRSGPANVSAAPPLLCKCSPTREPPTVQMVPSARERRPLAGTAARSAAKGAYHAAVRMTLTRTEVPAEKGPPRNWGSFSPPACGGLCRAPPGELPRGMSAFPCQRVAPPGGVRPRRAPPGTELSCPAGCAGGRDHERFSAPDHEESGEESRRNPGYPSGPVNRSPVRSGTPVSRGRFGVLRTPNRPDSFPLVMSRSVPPAATRRSRTPATTRNLLRTIFLLGLVPLLAFAACGNGEVAEQISEARAVAVPPAPTPADETDSRPALIAFGDSLTAGYGIEATEAWPARLQELLDAEDLGYRVVSAGASGETTSGGLRRLPWVLDRNPSAEVVVIALGGNDGLRGVPVDVMMDNLRGMIREAEGRGLTVLLAGVPTPPELGRDYEEGFRRHLPRGRGRHRRSPPPESARRGGGRRRTQPARRNPSERRRSANAGGDRLRGPQTPAHGTFRGGRRSLRQRQTNDPPMKQRKDPCQS